MSKLETEIWIEMTVATQLVRGGDRTGGISLDPLLSPHPELFHPTELPPNGRDSLVNFFQLHCLSSFRSRLSRARPWALAENTYCFLLAFLRSVGSEQ